jgi:prepilin-type processing-associated H-X9-DG protein
LLIVAVVMGVMCLCGGPILVALLLPAVQAAREAARRTQCANNLKQIGLAMHNYHDVHKCLPAGFIADEDGKPMHSWRVALLPFLERSDLYERYNFDEPWDSPTNLAIAEQMPEVFRCPSAPAAGPGSNMTNYVVILHDGEEQAPLNTMFRGNHWTRFRDIRDGTSNTLMVVEVREAVPWTQPDTDLQFSRLNFQINAGQNSLGSFHPQGAQVLFADGSVRFLSESLNYETLRLLIQPQDGQPISNF